VRASRRILIAAVVVQCRRERRIPRPPGYRKGLVEVLARKGRLAQREIGIPKAAERGGLARRIARASSPLERILERRDRRRVLAAQLLGLGEPAQGVAREWIVAGFRRDVRGLLPVRAGALERATAHGHVALH
jgi:hypothetical protein